MDYLHYYLYKQLELNKRNILDKISPETIFNYYLGNVKIGAAISAPYRKDKTPSFCLFQGNFEMMFKDHSLGISGNCIKLVELLFNCSYEEALNKINQDFNLGLYELKIGLHTNSKEISYRKEPNYFTGERKNIEITKKPFTKDELKYWSSYGINEEWLKYFNVHSCKFVFLNKTIIKQSTPKDFVFAYVFNQEEGDLRYKIYSPKSTAKQYRFLGNTDSQTIQGYEQMLVYKKKNNRLLIISKSLKDVMLLSTLGYCAVALNSESTTILPEVMDKLLGFEHTFLWYDNDEAGRIHSTRILKEDIWIDDALFIDDRETKDPTDYYKKYGLSKTKEMVKNIILNAIEKKSNY